MLKQLIKRHSLHIVSALHLVSSVIYFVVSNDRPLETRTPTPSALTPPWGQSGTTETCRIENSLYMGGKHTHTHVVQIQQKVE